MALPEFSIVIPVYNEGENIARLLRRIETQVRGDYEILIAYDFDEDTTLPAIAAMQPPVERVRLVRNAFGRGVVNAIRSAFANSRGWLGVVVTMADLSDPPERIEALVARLREGDDVVAGSRYMSGGQQIGGPLLKRTLSRLAGRLAWHLTGIGIHDVTTNFRAYSRRLIATCPIESQGGFELGLELTVKAYLRGWRVGEVPSTWHDRSAGESRFRLWKWLPGYLRWYMKLLVGDPLGLSPRLRRLQRVRTQPASFQYFGVYDKPGYGWFVHRFGHAVVVAAFTEEGRMILVKVHRPFHETGESAWETPGGGVEPGESPLVAGRRELFEETGYEPGDEGRVVLAGLEPAPGMASFPHHLVVFYNCRKTAEPEPGHEGIEAIAAWDARSLLQMMADREITALPTLAAIHLCAKLE